VVASLMVAAAPAQAATCATEGHAYLTQPGKAYFSGFNGDRSLGVPHVTVYQGERFRYGGNGINPFPRYGDTGIVWAAAEIDRFGGDVTGQINFLDGFETSYQPARDNCVANELGPYPVTAPTGFYLIRAIYTPGNHPGFTAFDNVVELQVIAPPVPSPGPVPGTNSAMSDHVEGSISLLGPDSAEPTPGGGGGDPDPSPCGGAQECPIIQ